MNLKKTHLFVMAIVMSILTCGFSIAARAERLQDLASIQGVRENHLVGYGIVVGLDGTGDQVRQAPFTQQSLTNLLAQLGVTLPQGTNMQLKNVAAVMVTTNLQPFAQPGQSMDVVVSSMGNAKSLKGGTLLMTPLKGADNQVYAMAQGNIVIGGAGASSGGSSVKVNQLNGGIITNGAVVERTVETSVDRGGYLILELNDTDYGTTKNVVEAINREFGSRAAVAKTGRTIEVQISDDENKHSEIVARLQSLDVKRGTSRGKVIINARTGIVVMNQTVTLDNAAVAFGSLTVSVDKVPEVSQPSPFSNGQTVVTQSTNINVQQQAGQLQSMKTSVNLADVVKALNSLGATPQDLVSILQALKSAGSLRADLEII